MRDFFQPGRSPVSALDCAVASSHALASAAALTVLTQGGNAVDAAVTATFVLCVVEPQSTGIGGDCFALVFPNGTDRPVGFNGSGRTPEKLDPAKARAEGGRPLAENSVHAVTIPGLVDGLARLLQRFGSWPLERTLTPANGYAENGFAIYPRVADEWAFAAPKLAARPASQALLPGGRPPEPGDLFRSPALAATLRLIASDGPDAFYQGQVARSMAAFLNACGGFHETGDFASHAGEWVTPISAPYRGHDVWQIPPNGQGAMALMMLNLLESFDLASLPFDGAERHGLIADAARIAFAERNRVIADPAFGSVPIDAFLDKAHARQLARNMGSANRDRTPSATPTARGDTAYVSVVDRDRNAVSLISSLFEGFGSGIFDPQTGVVFHNRGSGFSALENHPNALAPSKRPLHTIIPGMVSRDGRPVMSFGVTGGPYQPTGHVQLITAMVDHGLDMQDAIDRPRSFPLDGKLQLEPGLHRCMGDLSAVGHDVVEAPRAVGGAHGIRIDPETGVLTGGSDGRKDGCALAL